MILHSFYQKPVLLQLEAVIFLLGLDTGQLLKCILNHGHNQRKVVRGSRLHNLVSFWSLSAAILAAKKVEKKFLSIE